MTSPMQCDHRQSIDDNDVSLAEHPPGTPKLPFEPPRRRSSLAFSKIILSTPVSYSQEHSELADNASNMHFPNSPGSITNNDQPITTDPMMGIHKSSPNRDTRLQRLFRSAKATLHLDMHYAASPAGSIDSRLPSEPSPTMCSPLESISKSKNEVSKNWRYSTMPHLLAATDLDVREPILDSSPSFPEAGIFSTESHFGPIEPTSSSFASPLHDDECSTQHIQTLQHTPSSSPSKRSTEIVNPDVLESHMVNLKLSTNNGIEEENSPLILRQKRKSTDFPESPIYLSQTADAAAQSARAKRGLTRSFPVCESSNVNLDNNENFPEAGAYKQPAICPDPEVHYGLGSRLCPNPKIHMVSTRPDTMMGHLSFRYQSPDSPSENGWSEMPQPTLILPRASATGSPMPFARRRAPISPILPEHSARDHISADPTNCRPERSYRKYSMPPVSTVSEHFQPGWYYAQTNSNTRSPARDDLYSFSTAAAKATGESTAPDAQIRNSYRTDTLTPLAKPVSRFKKTGAGAQINTSDDTFNNTYSRVTRQVSRTIGPAGRLLYDGVNDMCFRSSPPTPTAEYSMRLGRRKRRRDHRALTPEFNTLGDKSLEHRNDFTHGNGNTLSPVRMNTFNTYTPTRMHSGGQEIRELSPNVNIWRKDILGRSYARKKRRPSYWDGDLEEVKKSPACRGGIASSPITSKRSMVAELEDYDVQDPHSDPEEHSKVVADSAVVENCQTSEDLSESQSGQKALDEETKSCMEENIGDCSISSLTGSVSQVELGM